MADGRGSADAALAAAPNATRPTRRCSTSRTTCRTSGSSSASSRRARTSSCSRDGGALGVELARQHRPALILLDLHLPDMDGEEVLSPAGRRAHGAIPVVVVSADADRRAGGAAARRRRRRFLTKPLEVSGS